MGCGSGGGRQRAPWWTAAHNGLGLLYTQSGDEEKAKLTLEQARKLDPFNFATTNYMRLLDDMDRVPEQTRQSYEGGSALPDAMMASTGIASGARTTLLDGEDPPFDLEAT